MRSVIIAAEKEDSDYYGYVLRHAGLSVELYKSVDELVDDFRDHAIDIIFMTVFSPDGTYHDVQKLRSKTPAPCILLADMPSEEQQCAWLDAGADLVMKRPLSPRVLRRYVQMLLRRAGTVPSAVLPNLETKGLHLNPTSRMVKLGNGQEQYLSPLEFRLLYLLMTNHGQVITTEVIVESVWGYSGSGNRELVRGLVRRLRRRIEPNPGEQQYIVNVPGVGYRFDQSLI